MDKNNTSEDNKQDSVDDNQGFTSPARDTGFSSSPHPQEPATTPTIPETAATRQPLGASPPSQPSEPPKKNKKKIILIAIAVSFGLFLLLAAFSDLPEEETSNSQNQQAIEREQPAGTTLERFADQKVEMAIPEGWEIAEDIEYQNTFDPEESEKEHSRYEFVILFLDRNYIDSLEEPTISLSVYKHGYINDDIALSKLSGLEKQLSNLNDNDVLVSKEEVRVGKYGKYKAYLYAYEDTFDKKTTEKIKNYRLYVAAHGNYYYVFGHFPVEAADKYDAILKAAVQSINPDE